MGAIEWMAWAVIVLAVVKMVVILISPRAWIRGVVRPFYTKWIFEAISIVAVLGGFYYLTRELTIVQIFASFFVVMFLIALGLRPYAKELVPTFERALSKGSLWRMEWFALALWALLIAWAAYYLIRY